MGQFFSRENARIEELESTTNNAYRYPPKNGKYFASHFIMGGEKFQTQQPEAYLFGENMDLNFLGGKPAPFPYAAPQPNEPTRTLRSLINIRKESLRFLRSPEASESERQSAENAPSNTCYNIEFHFDSDVRCNITIYYFCSEEITPNAVTYTPRNPSLNSETYHYKKGVNQQFSQVSHVFDPSKYPEDQLAYKFETEVIPVLIQCVAEEGEEPRQSHMLLATVEKNADDTYTLKPLKQKIFIDGILYLLQEIYGIENKNVCPSKNLPEEDVDTGFDCVICISDIRDTLILPCRHLCLCNSCADSLRYQANNCPICRAPFRALLSIRAVRRSNAALPQISHSAENQPAQDIPPGFEPISLVEALNGPMQPSAPLVPSLVPAPIPPFTNSPDVRPKHRHLDRHHSSNASLRVNENITSEREGSPSSVKLQEKGEASSVPEVVVASITASDKLGLKTESLSLTRGEGRRHRKGFRTSSAPEKMRLLANSMQIVNEVGTSKRKMEKDAELAETRSLLESNATVEEMPGTVCSPKTSRSCSRSSPISLSTPHSLHLCEKSSKDTSPGGEDSDYFTPEDPSTTILVDQGTDTSLDTPQGTDSGSINDSSGKIKSDSSVTGKHKVGRERHIVVDEQENTSAPMHDKRKRNSDPLNKPESTQDTFTIPTNRTLVVNIENPRSLPGTPASNASNHSSGESFSSSSSTRLLLRPHSYETLPE
ncbi:e3 ubiquitin-protein ligase MGRN1 [Trichonephila inaurata madagascariensis]|uniref:RING-type E3 ubiquitin transferase n=1 Tax=Trichonephila inaurata madagascariensis TaxID=2747483 RepID=A0A8X6WZC5_9ARAC|nr:e3 ubiquitin-protein ligase MGRN1 [Trichonephila inaurata madagascariensis]